MKYSLLKPPFHYNGKRVSYNVILKEQLKCKDYITVWK